MIYYVVGIAGTRGEFDINGVAKSLKNAEAFKKQIKDSLYADASYHVAIKKVDGIK